MENRLATGQEIYDFLMEDSCHCFSEDGKLIPGDHNLWYFCNEKFGFLVVEDEIWTWETGESSFDIVEEFVQEINSMGLFTTEQFQTLMNKIAEGRIIGSMYEIGKYLIAKRDGSDWKKKPDAANFREYIKQMIEDVERSYRENGYRFYRS
jgi:hypothetical protein